jgi:deoxycytidylate deaminase
MGSVVSSNSISGNAGVGGATVNLTGAATETTTADGSGDYSFGGLGDGNYTVTPIKQGATFNPASQNVTISGSDVSNVDFTLLSPGSTINNGVPRPVQIFGRIASGPYAGEIAAVACDEYGNLAISGGSGGAINTVDLLGNDIATPCMIYGALPTGQIVAVGVDSEGNLCATVGSGGGDPNTIVDSEQAAQMQASPVQIFARDFTSGNVIAVPLTSSNALYDSVNPGTTPATTVDQVKNGVPTPVILCGRTPSGDIVAVSLDSSGRLCISGSGSSRIVKSVVAGLENALLTEKNVRNLIKRSDPTRDDEIDRRMRLVSDLIVVDSGVSRAVHSSKLKEITEYGRAVHAELDALLTCARLGLAVKGKRIFTTTFPCHNCTRHIIAAGLSSVTYIEPYPKSRAADLHQDAICFDADVASETGKIPFLPFVGVGPRRYLDLFSLELSTGAKVKRKEDDGRAIFPARAERPPRVPTPAYSYLQLENKLLIEHEGVIKRLQGKPNGQN